MSQKSLTRIVMMAMIMALSIGAVFTLSTKTADAGIYNADSDTVYAEYWVKHAGNFSGLCDNTGLSQGFVQTFIEPKQGVCEKSLNFTMPSLGGNNSVEIYVDLWRNHDSKSAAYSINGNPFIQTDVGYDWSRTPYLNIIPNNQFQAGSNNTITFKDTSGQYHVKDVAFRVYGPATANTPSGGLTGIAADNGAFDPASGGSLLVDSDQLVLTATASANTDYIEFHAYYDGYDEDNDGDFRDWHNKGRNNWHPGGMSEKPTGGTVDHIGTVPVNGAGVYTITWNLPHIISQTGVRFKVRLVNHDGNLVNYVRDAAGGVSAEFELARTKPTVYFINPDFEDVVLHNDGASPDVATTTVELPPDISAFDTAYLIGAYWNNPKISINNGPIFYPFPDANPFPNGEWHLSVREINFNNLKEGTNTIRYEHLASFGEFIERPGPMIVLKRTAPLGGPDNTPPYAYGESPADDTGLVEPDATISVNVFDAGGMDINNDLSMAIKFGNGSFQTVNPTISGNTFNASLTYDRPGGLPFKETVTVRVTACDQAGNCMTPYEWSFETRQELLPSNIVSDDFNACALDTGVWTFVNTKGDGQYTTDGETISLFAPGGVVHDLFGGDRSAPRIMQPANDQDFDLEVKFESTVTQRMQAQGILVEQDANNYLRFELFYTDNEVFAHSYATVNGVLSPQGVRKKITGAALGGPLYLRIIRSDLTGWTLYYSQNGTSWPQAQSFTLNGFNVSQVGVYVINWSNIPANAPEHTAVIDYFLNHSDPFVGGEDPIANKLPVFVQGEGSVTKSAACGYPLTVEAVESTPGWSFDSWSGAYSGVDNPKTFTDPLPKGASLTAVFTRDEYTLDVSVEGIDHEGGSSAGAGGSVTITPNQSVYYYDDEVTLKAVPAAGWEFTRWERSGVSFGTNPNKTLVMQQSETLTAVFTQQKYTLSNSVANNEGGTIDVIGFPAGRDYLIYGDQITLQAVPIPNSDWRFVGWGGDLAGSENPIIVTITADLNVIANFSDQFLIFLPLITASP